jgi:uncharacterized protein
MTDVLTRLFHTSAIERLFRSHPIVAILGPRQVGKTTLARMYSAANQTARHFDLESPDDLALLGEPTLALGRLENLVVIDEIQRRPDLFPTLRYLVDRPENKARFLLLGSASPQLLRQSSESLAGRIAYHELGGFSLAEVGVAALHTLWRRGGYPRAFLAENETESLDWREQFVRTFLERDVPQLGLRLPAPMLRRFWAMTAHYHGQIWNAAEIARSLGVSEPTVRRYLDALCETMVLRRLAPWFENLGKRQVKAPKVYVADSGLAHLLLGVGDQDQLDVHPKLGASWEGFLLGQIVQRLGVAWEDCNYWRTQQGAELDLLVMRGNTRRGFEVKRTTVPEISKSMRIALADLSLDSLDVIHAGPHTFPLGERVRAVAATRILEDIAPV